MGIRNKNILSAFDLQAKKMEAQSLALGEKYPTTDTKTNSILEMFHPKTGVLKAIIKIENNQEIVYIQDPSSYIYQVSTEKIISNYCRDAYKLRINDIKEIVASLEDKLGKFSDIYTNTSYKELKQYEIPVGNGILNIMTKELYPYETSNYFVTSKISTNYVKDAKAPSTPNRLEFNQFINDFCGGDKKRVTLLIQILRTLIFNPNLNKFFTFTGPGGDGKSTLSLLISALIGEDNIASANFTDMSDSNKLAQCIGKRLIFGDDNNSGYKISDSSTIKQLSNRSMLSLAIKYRAPMNSKFEGQILQICNETPSFPKGDGLAMKGRWVNLSATSRFREKANVISSDKIEHFITSKEYCEHVLSLLCDENYEPFYIGFEMMDTQSIAEALDGSDPAIVFLQELFEILEGSVEAGTAIKNLQMMPITYLFELYTIWLQNNNPSTKTQALRTFSKSVSSKLEDMGYQVLDKRKRINGADKFDAERIGKQLGFDDYQLDKLKSKVDTNPLQNVLIIEDTITKTTFGNVMLDSKKVSMKEYFNALNVDEMIQLINDDVIDEEFIDVKEDEEVIDNINIEELDVANDLEVRKEDLIYRCIKSKRMDNYTMTLINDMESASMSGLKALLDELEELLNN